MAIFKRSHHFQRPSFWVSIGFQGYGLGVGTLPVSRLVAEPSLLPKAKGSSTKWKQQGPLKWVGKLENCGIFLAGFFLGEFFESAKEPAWKKSEGNPFKIVLLQMQILQIHLPVCLFGTQFVRHTTHNVRVIWCDFSCLSTVNSSFTKPSTVGGRSPKSSRNNGWDWFGQFWTAGWGKGRSFYAIVITFTQTCAHRIHVIFIYLHAWSPSC